MNKNLLGLHKLTTLKVNNISKLIDLSQFIFLTEKLLKLYQLEQVGNTSFVFENGSFTVAFCLKESHICIHTWPEIQSLTMDVYLCNYSQDNSEKVRKITDSLIHYFEGIILKQIEVAR